VGALLDELCRLQEADTVLNSAISAMTGVKTTVSKDVYSSMVVERDRVRELFNVTRNHVDELLAALVST
jgi:hypothetical protein